MPSPIPQSLLPDIRHPRLPLHLHNTSSTSDPGNQRSLTLLAHRSLSDLSGTSLHTNTHSAIILAGITVGIIAGIAFASFCAYKVVEYCQSKRKRDVEAQEAGCTPKIRELESSASGPTTLESVTPTPNTLLKPCPFQPKPSKAMSDALTIDKTWQGSHSTSTSTIGGLTTSRSSPVLGSSLQSRVSSSINQLAIERAMTPDTIWSTPSLVEAGNTVVGAYPIEICGCTTLPPITSGSDGHGGSSLKGALDFAWVGGESAPCGLVSPRMGSSSSMAGGAPGFSTTDAADVRNHGTLQEETQVKRSYEDVSEDVASLATLKDRLLRRKVSSELRAAGKENANPV